MSRHLLPVCVALVTACGVSPLASELAAENRVSSSFAMKGPEERFLRLTTDSLRMSWSRTEYDAGSEGPEELRAVARQLEGCGQAPDDLLDVRVHAVVGHWPWDVRIVSATPGAEGCLVAVLSQLPLDTDLRGGARYLAARVRVADLLKPAVPKEEPECRLMRPMKYPGTPTFLPELPALGTMTFLQELPSRGTVAHRVTCAAEPPLTELTLRYVWGELVEASTQPPVDCVEAAAEEALGSISVLGLPNSGPDAEQTAAEWPTAVCTLPVPLL